MINPSLARPISQHTSWLLAGSFLLLALLVCVAPSLAQPPAGAGTSSANSKRSLPDSPQPKQDQANETQGPGRFVGYITKRSLFFPDIATSPGRITSWQKFELFGNEAIAPETLLTSSVSALYSQARGTPYADGGGWPGYGKRFGASMARGASNNFFGTFVLASAFHQDPRFFPRSNPRFWSTIKYAARRVVITRTDAGNEVIDSSGLLGPALGESLANVYLPTSEQTAGKTFERYGYDLVWRFAGNVFKDYWPTLFKGLGLQRLKVLPPPAPVSITPPGQQQNPPQ
jgi:hypothetical protein